MPEVKATRPNYGNWVSPKLIYISAALTLLFGALSVALAGLTVVAVVFFISFAYFAYARYKFSPAGGNIQARIRNLVLDHLDWDGTGQALDIGCGNAALTIGIAKKHPNARVTGIDYWGPTWAYSQRVCQQNAEIEGTAERTTFQKASASQLPFADGTFGAAVSNLVFHEVADVKDKREVLKEALRVVKKGGRFAFQDLFLWRQAYGNIDDLLETIRSWGVKRVEFVDTSKSTFIPKALRLPFMVGTIAILHGEK